MRNNYAEQSDSIFQFQPSSNKNSFINIEDYVTNLKKEDKNGTVFLINYIKDSKSITYQRSVLTFLDWCGFIGGVNEVLHLAGMLIVSSLSGRIFVFSLLSALYQVRAIAKHGRNAEINNLTVPHENKIEKSNKQNSKRVFPWLPALWNENNKRTENAQTKVKLLEQATNEMK